MKRLEKAWRKFEQRLNQTNLDIPDKLRLSCRGMFYSGAIAALAELVNRTPGENPIAEMLEELSCFEMDSPLEG